MIDDLITLDVTWEDILLKLLWSDSLLRIKLAKDSGRLFMITTIYFYNHYFIFTIGQIWIIKIRGLA